MASIFTPEVGLLFDKQPITSGTAMADLDRLHHQCLNFGRAFTARRLQRSETVFNIIHVRDRCAVHLHPPHTQKTITLSIPKSLVQNYNSVQKFRAIIYCDHVQTFNACLTRWKENSEATTKLLLLGCIQKDMWTSASQYKNSSRRRISVKISLTVSDGYMQRSLTLGDLRYTKRLWSSWIRDGIMQFTGLYFAVLGGAYSSLAKANSRYAKKAGSLAKRQIRLAQLVNDPVQECKCWLYYAEDLIHLGKLDRAKRILKAQVQYAKDNQNTLLETMCESVDQKLGVAEDAILNTNGQRELTDHLGRVSI